MISGAARSKSSASIACLKLGEASTLCSLTARRLLEVADSFELVNAVDAAIIVVNPDDGKASDHLEMADRFRRVG